jgi:hypothetical protein
MERRVGEHDAEEGVVRSNEGGEGTLSVGVWERWSVGALERWSVGKSAEEEDGGFGGTEEAFFEWGEFADGADGIEGREHQGEGFFFAMFSFAQEADGVVKVRGSHEVEAAEAFDGEDLAGA